MDSIMGSYRQINDPTVALIMAAIGYADDPSPDRFEWLQDAVQEWVSSPEPVVIAGASGE